MSETIQEERSSVVVDKSAGKTEEKRPEWPWRKAKKVAIMISFVGKDYLGMQRNQGFKTIEEDLLKAFKESGVIDPEWYENPPKGHFQRASRTDKGVSAAKMVVSMRMLLDDKREDTITKINSKLPPCIKIQAIRKVTKNFNCKSACDSRTYLYLIPTFAFAPVLPLNELKSPEEEVSPEMYQVTYAYRMKDETRNYVNDVLQKFIGSKYYHNYTSGKLPLEPSSQRFITHFEIGEPFEKEGMEFAVIKIKGQSFMLHQIRKMIGMAISVVRGQCPMETIEKSWDTMRIDIPRAPGLGLMLDENHYERYNKRFGSDGIHESLTWENEENEIENFKENFIFSEMIQGEKEHSMFNWLKCLPMHGFVQRHFENSEPLPRSPFRIAELKVEDLNKESKQLETNDDENIKSNN